MRPFRVLRRLFLAVLVLAIIVVGVTALRVYLTGRQDNARRSDALLVLGAAQYNGEPSSFLMARLQHAQKLFDAGTAPRVITLGGKQPGDRFTEADAGQTYLVDHGVPSERILRVGEGNDTLVSIQAAAATMKQRGWHTAVIVTDPWHELRSTTMLRDQGIEAYGSPVDSGPSLRKKVTVTYVGRETAAYLVYIVRRSLS